MVVNSQTDDGRFWTVVDFICDWKLFVTLLFKILLHNQEIFMILKLQVIAQLHQLHSSLEWVIRLETDSIFMPATKQQNLQSKSVSVVTSNEKEEDFLMTNDLISWLLLHD